MSEWGPRYVVMVEHLCRHRYPACWTPAVVEAIPRRYWETRSHIAVKADSYMTFGPLSDLRDPHIEEVAPDDPLLLGPFNQSSPDGVQHYVTLEAAQRNLERLVLLMVKKNCLRSSVVERPLRKRQVESSNLSGGSKWIRRLEYQMAHNERHWRSLLDEHPTWLWAARQIEKKRGSPTTPAHD